MSDKRSNQPRRAVFDSTMSQIQRALAARCQQKTRAELEALAAQMTRLRMKRWLDGVIDAEPRRA